MTSTVEDYLKQLATIELEQNLTLISMKQIGAALGVTPGTATSMIKRLDAQGLVEYRHHKGCLLTDTGRRAGLKTLRRHRLIEFFLVKTLGMDWNEVHGEAERIEHSISQKVSEKLDRFLGYPERDPHGGPIPSPEGTMPEVNHREFDLDQAMENTEIEIISVKDSDSNFLRYLENEGIMPGQRFTVLSNSEWSGIIEMASSGNSSPQTIRLSLHQACLIRAHNGPASTSSIP